MSSSPPIPVRFLLTGACHPYSGRQLLFAVPQEKVGVTTEALLNKIVRPQWPHDELPELESEIDTSHLRVLIGGQLMAPKTDILEVLRAAAPSAGEDGVVAHLVFSGALKRSPGKQNPNQQPAPHPRRRKDEQACCVIT